MGAPNLESAVAIPEDVVFRELDGEAVILNLATGIYFGLDPVGTRMWQLLAERRQLRHVWQALQDEYEAAPDRLERDLIEFVELLHARQLVTIA